MDIFSFSLFYNTRRLLMAVSSIFSCQCIATQRGGDRKKHNTIQAQNMWSPYAIIIQNDIQVRYSTWKQESHKPIWVFV